MSLTDYEMLQNEVAEQKQEITKLKLALQQNDDEIKNSESVKASIAALTAAKINGLINENNELKAQIFLIKQGWEAYGETGFDEALFVIEETPAQCLQSVKADAVDDVYDMIATDGANIEDAGELIGHTRVLLSVGERANKLRESKS